MKIQVLSKHQIERLYSVFIDYEISNIGVMETGDVNVEYYNWDNKIQTELIPFKHPKDHGNTER